MIVSVHTCTYVVYFLSAYRWWIFHDALDQLVILGVVNEVESALRSYECKTTAKQHESANSEIKIEKIKFLKMTNRSCKRLKEISCKRDPFCSKARKQRNDSKTCSVVFFCFLEFAKK